jgi:hypothetical protein
MDSKTDWDKLIAYTDSDIQLMREEIDFLRQMSNNIQSRISTLEAEKDRLFRRKQRYINWRDGNVFPDESGGA